MKGFYSIIGKGGSGKSMLLNILVFFDKPIFGNVAYCSNLTDTLAEATIAIDYSGTYPFLIQLTGEV